MVVKCTQENNFYRSIKAPQQSLLCTVESMDAIELERSDCLYAILQLPFLKGFNMKMCTKMIFKKYASVGVDT
jgi:hypothetical protein